MRRRQSIYIMVNPAYPFRFKVGISHHAGRRARSISESMPGIAIPLLSVRTWQAARLEKSLHALYSPLQARMTGSGRTEWFYTVNLLCTAVLLIYWPQVGQQYWWAALFAPIPIDAICILILVRCIELSTIVAIAAAIFYFLTYQPSGHVPGL